MEDFRLNEYKPEDFQEINLYEWLKQETNSRKKEYDIRVTTKEVNPEDVFNIKVVASAIRDLFENLLENVEKHGFERELKNYKVLFELSIQDEIIIIEFKNDGNPLPNGFDEKKYFTSGAGAGKNKGSGFGGFFIARTLRKHEGNLEFIPTPQESNYTVHFRIKLPKKTEV